jgi:hypothetical protein
MINTTKIKKMGLSSEQIYKIHPHEKSANRSEKHGVIFAIRN